jgi:hypothetical protein
MSEAAHAGLRASRGGEAGSQNDGETNQYHVELRGIQWQRLRRKLRVEQK